jgi:hypothetical protein
LARGQRISDHGRFAFCDSFNGMHERLQTASSNSELPSMVDLGPLSATSNYAPPSMACAPLMEVASFFLSKGSSMGSSEHRAHPLSHQIRPTLPPYSQRHHNDWLVAL